MSDKFACIADFGVRQAGPVVTDNGNFVVDVDFGEIECNEVAELDRNLQNIPVS